MKTSAKSTIKLKFDNGLRSNTEYPKGTSIRIIMQDLVRAEVANGDTEGLRAFLDCTLASYEEVSNKPRASKPVKKKEISLQEMSVRLESGRLTNCLETEATHWCVEGFEPCGSASGYMYAKEIDK